MGSAFICGRRGSQVSGKVLIARCDHGDGCSREELITTPAEYSALAAAGWRRRGDDVRCPDHASDYAAAG